jgi:hypothetical protein
VAADYPRCAYVHVYGGRVLKVVTTNEQGGRGLGGGGEGGGSGRLCLPVAALSKWHYYCDMQAPQVCLHPSVFSMMPSLLSHYSK